MNDEKLLIFGFNPTPKGTDYLLALNMEPQDENNNRYLELVWNDENDSTASLIQVPIPDPHSVEL